MSQVEAESEVTVVEGLVEILIVGMEGAGVELVKQAAANSLGAIPFLHIIRSAIATEANSPSKIGPGQSLERGRQGEGVREEEEWSYIGFPEIRLEFSCSPSGVVISCQITPSLKLTIGEATCQRCCSSLIINAREILITLIFSKGLFQVFDLQLTCKDVYSSEEAGG